MSYSKNTLALLWLNSSDMPGAAKKYKLIELAGEPYKMFSELEKYKYEIINICDEAQYERLSVSRDKSYMDMLVKEIERYDIEPIGICDNNYPALLKEIDTPPVLLYCKGNTALLNERLMAVVGTRLPTRYGRDVTEMFVKELVSYGFRIVSGLARGIDTIAHRTALKENSPQIAVLGSGPDTVYPAENRELYDAILTGGGLIISEYRVGEKPLSFHFPERNRIISGLCEGVLVTEAGENSGSLITVNHAVDQGRRVYIVPGNIFSKQSAGANEKLKQLQGALVTDINDILKDYNIDVDPKNPDEPIQLDITENQILNALSQGEMHTEELIKLTGLQVNELNSILMKMEINGLIKKLYGNYYGV